MPQETEIIFVFTANKPVRRQPSYNFTATIEPFYIGLPTPTTLRKACLLVYQYRVTIILCEFNSFLV